MRQRSTPAGFLRSRSSSSPVPSTASPAVPTRCTACPCWSRAASLRWPCSLVPSFSVAARMTTVTVMMQELLPLRRRGRPDRALPDSPCPPSQDRRRGPGHRPGPQRGRRPARRRGPRSGRRARPDLVAGPQRAAGVRSHRGEHRGPRRRAGASDPDGAAQGRQDRHHPAGAAHGPGRGPRGRRTLRRTDLHHSARWLPRPSRRGSDRPTGRPAGRDHQADRPPHTAALDTDVPLRDVQEAASHADPRTTMRHDRARVSLDRHATYIAGGGRQVSRPGARCRQPPSTLNAEYALGAGSSSNPVGWRRSSSSVVRSPPRELLGGHPGRWPSPALCGPASRSLPGDRRPT